MRRDTPVQVIIIRNRSDTLSKEYVALLKQVFTGTLQEQATENLYFSEPLGVDIPLLDPDIIDSAVYRRALTGGAKISVVVEIRSRNHVRWPKEVNSLLRNPDVVSVPINIPQQVAKGTIQMNATELGGVEPSFVPIAAALATLEKCRLELINKVYGPRYGNQPSKLFISHAKADGVAMAHAIVSLLNRLQTMPGFKELFEYFYDAESIQPGEEWREVLSQNAKSCLFMALLTEEYESRHWCRQEFLWAEKKHMPMLVVDLLSEMYHPASPFPVDSVESVKISDGNLIRVLFHALRCHINYLLLQYRINPKAGEIVIPRYPNAVSIAGALEMISESVVKDSKKIIYAGATLPNESIAAFNSHLETENVELMSEVEWEMTHA
ncbi:MAG: TIR domain-containing protein [Gammaproteobacteria bacterium]|nr:TIR domain-containing protein [Gammaproteobacteria bacterium]